MKRLAIALSITSLSLLGTLANSPRTLAYNAHAAPYVRVCPGVAVGAASCDSEVVTNAQGIPLASSSPPAGSYGPTQFHTGYTLPTTTSSSQIIGIVDAYDDPTIGSDLNTYDNQYGIASCAQSASGSPLSNCLTVVGQNGGSNLPRADSGWALEISLDVETAHEICQNCKILLVEASSNSNTNLGAAVNEAAKMGATEISNSYGGSESSGETTYDWYYNHPGIAVTASAGDGSYGAEYPAASPYVVSVGGTNLQLNSNNTYNSESVWYKSSSEGTGSGCSAYEPANSWQTAVSDWAQTQCVTHRGIADVSADADPNTGAAVYDSTRYQGQSGWYQVGGTSLSSPLTASVFALAGGTASYANAQQVPYIKFTSSNSHDVTVGSNGSCGTIMCKATTGYDGPTGLGTPNGTGGF